MTRLGLILRRITTRDWLGCDFFPLCPPTPPSFLIVFDLSVSWTCPNPICGISKLKKKKKRFSLLSTYLTFLCPCRNCVCVWNISNTGMLAILPCPCFPSYKWWYKDVTMAKRIETRCSSLNSDINFLPLRVFRDFREMIPISCYFLFFCFFNLTRRPTCGD